MPHEAETGDMRCLSAWFALSVRSRHEFVTYEDLRKKGVEVYLPSIKLSRRWKDREKLVEFPLLPGYLFVNINPSSHQRLTVLKARGAVRLLSSPIGRPIPIPAEEIYSLKLLVASGEELDVFPHIREGMKVKIVKGVLNGAEGVLVEKGAYATFCVNVSLLGKSISVRVLAEDIEPAGSLL